MTETPSKRRRTDLSLEDKINSGPLNSGNFQNPNFLAGPMSVRISEVLLYNRIKF